jgi:Tfp pilus assembly protein FimT
MTHDRASNRQRRAAFTLMELLLVLAVLIVAGAILIPAVQGPLQNQKLRKSADLMRAAWNRSRVNAMRTGLIHVFEYQADTGTYTIRPWVAEQDATEANPLETPLGDVPGANAYQAYAQQEQLPDEIIFVQGSAETDLRWQMHLADEGSENLPDGLMSPPIVFYPDGTTSNAQIWLSTEERKYFISVQMRGMTGVSRAGPLLSAEEMQ